MGNKFQINSTEPCDILIIGGGGAGLRCAVLVEEPALIPDHQGNVSQSQNRQKCNQHEALAHEIPHVRYGFQKLKLVFFCGHEADDHRA